MTIGRRKFIEGSAASMILILSGLTNNAAAQSVKPSSELSENQAIYLVKSIKAYFGSAFQILESGRQNGLVVAEIEHLENRYRVVSADWQNWKILSSTVI